jgi:hypothetical protein
MKIRLLTAVLLLAASFLNVTPARAQVDDEVAVVTDAVIARPLCFAATIIGSAIFVVSLPAALPSKSVDSVADILVRRPAWATFNRPLGDFSFASDYASTGPAKRHHKKAIVRSPKAQAEAARG